ncbi:acetolactate synthase I/II/III large subunit [Flexivirga endophytica]|uniref:Acetolactate synthase I/II/III large subunit n=1 Tax=Flexivirga endophytica TaxID=1849103 RepID=A0A916T4J1_9MICO|nr:thiamine pyrophosphate-binding protein [Flexivirga endophytica]GGB31159.1 acetolactate synthase I/II/III large subunit [Flexivirga endophytica]GHB52109.1 acetolactate synthase I/II/III large subunit [Flexivirga endophytica]
MKTAELIGRTLVESGVDHVFGVVGSGNFDVTDAMAKAGARYVAARHEGGAATMADAYARMTGGVAALTVHQGCGLTNAMTGITEAAKSRTPMVVLAAEATQPLSNFYVDQTALAESVDAVAMRVDDSATARHTTRLAVQTALADRRVVLLNLPLEVQEANAPDQVEPATSVVTAQDSQATAETDVRRLADVVRTAERPIFVAGRGSRGPGCGEALEALADQCGALLATSAVAKGLFNGNPWSLDVSGGFASPLTADLIKGADLIVGWGCALNMWTMRHGRLIADEATVVQVDLDADALGAHRDIAFGVVGDVRRTAEAVSDELCGDTFPGYRTDQLGDDIAAHNAWRDVPYDDAGTGERIDPRTLCLALDELLPIERVLGVDSGNFMGYPSMFLRVPDEFGFCFTQAFQSIGLGLATTIGAALARPDRLPIAALGDGGALMSAAELETVARLGIPMVVLIFNDQAYGAEVHHFHGRSLDSVTFPDTDFAAIGRGYGYDAITVRNRDDLAPVADWLAERSRPLLIDAKVVADEPSWWLAEAFGH